jgi:DNA-binding MarR family transcriptional regulator
MARDYTDYLLERWSLLQPGLDMNGLQVTARLSRLGVHLARREEEVFGRLGLNRGEVGVLSALRVVGPPHRLSPTRLGRGLMLSSAGITSRLDRLERRGLLKRIPDPEDRRGVIVELTDQGIEVVDAAVVANTAADKQVLSQLSQDEIDQLDRLLRRMLSAMEPPGLE